MKLQVSRRGGSHSQRQVLPVHKCVGIEIDEIDDARSKRIRDVAVECAGTILEVLPFLGLKVLLDNVVNERAINWPNLGGTRASSCTGACRCAGQGTHRR